MHEIIKVYREKAPAARFIGKMYLDGDRDETGGFGRAWGEFFQKGWFDAIEEAAGGKQAVKALSPEGDAYCGLERYKPGEPFQYWVGMFVPLGTIPPEGLAAVDFGEMELGTCWIRGEQADLFGHEDECAQACEREGWTIRTFPDGAYWSFERYGCSRFMTPDAQGNVILDICIFLE